MNDLGPHLGIKPKYTLSYSVFRPMRRHTLNNLAKSIATAMHSARLSKLHSPH